ncbi:MAG: DUF4349 domain-containing protein [Chloroflexota bacterium]|nr:DUF4349 domain-containing protein [Dehalococcoidia bacterium]MDW8253575.1 DUF4349 domain-containing protein [Chloroflexota bacterium]
MLSPSTAPRGTEARPSTGETSLPSEQAILGLRRIIFTGDIQLEVANPLETMARVQRLVQDAGGYVASSNAASQGDAPVVTMTLRVPAEHYSNVMEQLRRVGDKVRSEKTTSQDVSEEYADLNAQLRNLEAAEAQYLELMRRAQSIDEVLKVQQQLTAVRGQIERIKGRLTYLERRVEMATINVGLYPPAVRPQNGYANPLDAAAAAWGASLRFLAAAASGVVAVVVFFWWAIPLLALAGWRLAGWLRRRSVTAAS